MARIQKKTAKDESAARRKTLDSIAEKFSAFRPASEVLVEVRAVPTIFPDFDRQTRVNGYPTDRVVLVHGPSNEGKTELMLGIAASFCRRGHPALLLDAEHTTPFSWVKKMFGDIPTDLLYAVRPENYEHARDVTRAFAQAVGEKRKIDPDATGFIGVDSVRKLVPKNLMDLILKEAKIEAEDEAPSKARSRFEKPKAKGIDGMNGRMAQHKAALNAAWMDELIPLIDRCGVGVMLIARETEDPDADPFEKKMGRDFKIGGGKSLVYDSSLAVRVERAGYVTTGSREDKTNKIVGEKRSLTIWKTKVGEKEAATAVASFHTSNGQQIPFGFDIVRDLFALGKMFDIVNVSGSWYRFGTIAEQGEEKFLAALRQDVEAIETLELQVREHFVDSPSHDADGVIE